MKLSELFETKRNDTPFDYEIALEMALRAYNVPPVNELNIAALGKKMMTRIPIQLPETINGNFFAYDNALTSFDNFPKYVKGAMYIEDNKFTSLHNIHKSILGVYGKIDLTNNPIKSDVLGVLLIKGVTAIYITEAVPFREKHKLYPIETILNKHLGKGRQSVMDAQQELIEAGYPEFAQL